MDEQTPPVPGLGRWAEAIKSAADKAVTPEALAAIVAAQVAKAKTGDVASARFVLGLAARLDRVERPPPAPAPSPLVVQLPAKEPKPLKPPTPTVLQRLAGTLMKEAPMMASVLARQLEIEPQDLDAVLAPEYFQHDGREWSLTTAGRRIYG